MKLSILNAIADASQVIGTTWPLYTFVASNPLSGYERQPFEKAVASARAQLNARAYPSLELYRQAWQDGAIDNDILSSLLAENGYNESPEHYLEEMGAEVTSEEINKDQLLDRITAKWLSAFLDEGLAEWEMPYKSEGFFAAWRLLAVYDSELGTTSLKEIPKTSMEALERLMEGYNETQLQAIFKHHLGALPGWTGYINHRASSFSEWHTEFPIDMADYLAMRLWTARELGIQLLPQHTDKQDTNESLNLSHLWLQAWERTYQEEFIKLLKTEHPTHSTAKEPIPDAQLVFCIDTRSEQIRKHVEDSGNYETFGYAGFFGIAMDYKNMKDGISRKSCPPIVNSAYTVTEQARPEKTREHQNLQQQHRNELFQDYFLKRMKNMLPSAFGFVEGSGLYYGWSLLKRTLLPGASYRRSQRKENQLESICEPKLQRNETEPSALLEIPLEEKAAIVKGAFDLMGWKRFANLVVFVGHGSHSSNNPFSSSLDCGACAASPGRHNARMLATLANLPEVREFLAKEHRIFIPADTIFLGAEHNTTTDAIELFDSEVPEFFKTRIHALQMNLEIVQRTASRSRLNPLGDSLSAVQRKANNWSETRPEWGLAKNSGFVIGPRSLTKDHDLEGRCFLHSYDWSSDTEGKALEGIMQGPMVVTQWINNHYYFSTIDNDTYGGGSKITHNITGKYGVVQGNGGDLKMGLPLQSLYESDTSMYHQPLRLSVMIQAPVNRVSEILLKNDHLKELLDNEWIYLMVMDPEQENMVLSYQKGLSWEAYTSDVSTKVSEQENLKAIVHERSIMN